MVFGHKFTEIRHEFVIGTTRLVVKTTDRIVGKPRISRITRMLFLFMSNLRRFYVQNGNLCPDTPCLILNMVDTKSLKKYGETTPRKPLCERFNSH